MATRGSTRLGCVLVLLGFTLHAAAGASYRARPQPAAVLQGQTVTLPCAFDSLAEDDTVIWQGGPDDKTIAFGGNVLKVYRRHRITGDAARGEYNLEIAEVKPEDGGKYSCYTDPKAAADAILTVVVPMTGPPAVKGGELPVTAGEQLSLTCRSTGGHPAPRLTWLNGTRRFRDASASNQRDRTLELFVPRLTKWDHGANFTCLADQGFPQLARPKASSRILRVKYPPQVQVPSPSVHVREGEPASLSCMVDSNPKATVTWRKVGGTIPVLNMMRDHVLHLPKVSKRDGGLYQCDANNGVLPTGSGTVTLQVYYPPVIDTTMEDEVTMLYGQDDASVQCVAAGNPKPHIRWRRKDTSLYWDNPLRFHRVRYDVQGTYQCVAASDGFQEVTKDVYVDVVGKPSIQRGLPAVSVAAGNTARFNCEILGDPLPGRVSWFWQTKQGEETVVMATEVGVSITENPTDDGTSSTLLLKDVGISQEGTYICQASNMFGEARREIRLEVFGTSGSLVVISVSMATAGLGILAAIIVCIAVKKRWICREEKRDPPTLPSGRSMPPVPKPGKRLGHGTNDSGVEDLELQELDGTLKPRPPPRAEKEWTSVGLSYTGLAHSNTLPPYTTVERHRPDGEDIRAPGEDIRASGEDIQAPGEDIRAPGDIRAHEGIPEEAIVPAAACMLMGFPAPPPKATKGKWKRRAPPGGTSETGSVREPARVLHESQAESI